MPVVPVTPVAPVLWIVQVVPLVTVDPVVPVAPLVAIVQVVTVVPVVAVVGDGEGLTVVGMETVVSVLPAALSSHVSPNPRTPVPSRLKTKGGVSGLGSTCGALPVLIPQSNGWYR